MQCFDAYNDAHGIPGQYKKSLAGFDTPMRKTEALKALNQLAQRFPDKDFSIRRVASVLEFPK